MPKQLPWGQRISAVHAWVAAYESSHRVTRADARHAVATEYGFGTWRQLEAYVTHPGDNADFLLLGCLSYFQTDRPDNRVRARKMLEADPGLGTRDIWHAACVGDVAAVARFLDEEPALVNQRGGHFDWAPLLYACYSRLDLKGHSTLGVAGLLIERGADPDSHYMWGGQYRFTALTGAFGEGEMGPVNQPPHEHCVALAGLLLDAGADPNDGQALYNTMFTPGHDCLAMLLDHGLNRDHRNNWRWARKDGVYTENPDRTLDYQLNWAVQKHHVERARLLIDRGADVTGRTPDGKTLVEAAVRAGHPDLARYLARARCRDSGTRRLGTFDRRLPGGRCRHRTAVGQRQPRADRADSASGARSRGRRRRDESLGSRPTDGGVGIRSRQDGRRRTAPPGRVPRTPGHGGATALERRVLGRTRQLPRGNPAPMGRHSR